MNDRQLRSFLLACKTGSLSRAADEALISKPAFVQQINLLQREVGFDLFVRSSRGVALTEAGAEFARVVEQALADLDSTVERCRLKALQDSLKVRVGYDPAEVAPFLGDVCDIARHGDVPVEIEFVEASYADQFEALTHDKIDAFFFADSSLVSELGLAFDDLYEDAWCCCMSPRDPLASHQAVSPADLAGMRLYIEPIYTHELGTCALLDWFGEHGVSVEVNGKAFDASVPAHILMNGGVLPVPSRYISDCVPPLKAVPLAWPASRYGVVHRPEESLGVRLFVQAARQFFEDEQAS